MASDERKSVEYSGDANLQVFTVYLSGLPPDASKTERSWPRRTPHMLSQPIRDELLPPIGSNQIPK